MSEYTSSPLCSPHSSVSQSQLREMLMLYSQSDLITVFPTVTSPYYCTLILCHETVILCHETAPCQVFQWPVSVSHFKHEEKKMHRKSDQVTANVNKSERALVH